MKKYDKQDMIAAYVLGFIIGWGSFVTIVYLFGGI